MLHEWPGNNELGERPDAVVISRNIFFFLHLFSRITDDHQEILSYLFVVSQPTSNNLLLHLSVYTPTL